MARELQHPGVISAVHTPALLSVAGIGRTAETGGTEARSTPQRNSGETENTRRESKTGKREGELWAVLLRWEVGV